MRFFDDWWWVMMISYNRSNCRCENHMSNNVLLNRCQLIFGGINEKTENSTINSVCTGYSSGIHGCELWSPSFISFPLFTTLKPWPIVMNHSSSLIIITHDHSLRQAMLHGKQALTWPCWQHRAPYKGRTAGTTTRPFHHQHHSSSVIILYLFSLKILFTVVSHIPYERLVKVSGPLTQNWIYKKLFILCHTSCYILNTNVAQTKIFNFALTTILTIIYPFHCYYDQVWAVWASFKTFYLFFLSVTVEKSTTIYYRLLPIISLNDFTLNYISWNSTFPRVSYTPLYQVVKVIKRITSYWWNY